MQLTYKKIPREFIEALPEGIRFVSKQKRTFLIVDYVLCPNGHSLMDDSVKIHGESSIKIKADTGKSAGHIYVDPFWGGHDKLYDFIPQLSASQTFLKIFCPACGIDLTMDQKCSQPDCLSRKHAMLRLPSDKNRIVICARLGCPEHHMEITDIPESVSDQIDEINFFNTYTDDGFQGI